MCCVEPRVRWWLYLPSLNKPQSRDRVDKLGDNTSGDGIQIALVERCMLRGLGANTRKMRGGESQAQSHTGPVGWRQVAASMLQQVVASARGAEARLLLLTVGLPLHVPPFQASAMPSSRTFQAEAYLDAVRASLANEGLEVSTMVGMGDPATEILGCAARQQVDLIVINSRGGGGSPVPFLGSVAKKVAGAATVPVIVFSA